jgi:hypothetical protein
MAALETPEECVETFAKIGKDNGWNVTGADIFTDDELVVMPCFFYSADGKKYKLTKTMLLQIRNIKIAMIKFLMMQKYQDFVERGRPDAVAAKRFQWPVFSEFDGRWLDLIIEHGIFHEDLPTNVDFPTEFEKQHILPLSRKDLFELSMLVRDLDVARLVTPVTLLLHKKTHEEVAFMANTFQMRLNLNMPGPLIQTKK